MLSLSFRIFLSKPIRFPKLDGVRSSCQFSSSVIVNSEGCERKSKIDWEFFILFCEWTCCILDCLIQRGIIPNPSWKGDIGKCFPPIRAEFDQLIFQCCIDVIPRKTHIDNSVQSNNILGIWIQKDWLAELRCEIFWFVSPSLDGKG